MGCDTKMLEFPRFRGVRGLSQKRKKEKEKEKREGGKDKNKGKTKNRAGQSPRPRSTQERADDSLAGFCAACEPRRPF